MILHVDMDAFYAAVEQRDRPELADRPVIVGGSADGRGVVAAGSYPARRYGIQSAMPTATAIRLCPELIVLPVRMDHYATNSRQIRDIFRRYTPLVEPLRHRLWELTDQVARRLRRSGRFGRAVQIKLRLSDFRTITRSRSLAQPSDITAELWQAASELLDAALPPATLARGIRLIGLAVTGLGGPPPVQQHLFTDDPATERQRHRQLDHVTDAIQARFGGKAITNAAG